MKIRLTRKVTFSAGHRFWRSDRSESENRALFGNWASPYNHGHNFVLEVSTEGPVDETTGMVVNIKTIDDEIREKIVDKFHLKSINDEVDGFEKEPPTLENLLIYIKGQLGDRIAGAELVGLRLEEMPDFWAAIEKRENWKMTLTRTYEFAAAHRLHIANLPDSENSALFGKCANPAGHGHNYLLEVTVSGETDPETGMAVDLLAIDQAVNDRVVDYLDHKNFNEDVPEFKGKITTTETVVQTIWDLLSGRLPAKLERVKLFETPRSSFEVSAG